MSLRKNLIQLFVVFLTITLVGCIYHQPIEQGNVITPANVQAIHNGMTSQQVIAKMGSPVMKNIYNDEHMDYVYTSAPTHDIMIVKKVIIVFRHNLVTDVRTEL
ncbi:MAG TPA: outer membrane protein assembly factor BamE [Coxiellaceae bacterium]|nr:outer membrane protein assembly factor BamE [Coxiellaceae bacterium]